MAFSAAKTFDAIGDIDAYVQCLSLIGLCRAGQVYEAIGDAEASSRCHAAVPPAP